VRDAHLGSIWEGTSNIVALDVIRVKRENSLPALQAHSAACSTTAPWRGLRRRPARCTGARSGLARPRRTKMTTCWRIDASTLYHVCSAIAMAWEGARARLYQWAQGVLLHRVLPRDPLAPDAVPAAWNAPAIEKQAATA
jgi:hypothetical protein